MSTGLRRLAVCLAALAALAAPDRAGAEGIEVVEAAPGLAARAAGLEPGDRLLRWSQAGAADAPLASPFDLLELEGERGPRGPVRLSGRRGGEPLQVELFPDDWGLDVRPELSPELGRLHDEARRLQAAGQTDAAVQRLRELEARVGGPSVEARCWALVEIARLERARRRPDAMAQALREAVGHARTAGLAPVQSRLLAILGQLL